MKKALYFLLRLSLLMTIIVLGFTALFPGWYDNRQIIFDEVSSRFMSPDDIAIREDARRKNTPFKEHKADVVERRLAKQRRLDLQNSFNAALDGGDNQRLKETLSQMEKRDVPSNIYARAIRQNNIGALSIIANAGIPCRYDGGSNVFASTKGAENVRVSQSLTLSAIYESSNPDVVAKWVALGCYSGQPYFAKNIVAKETLHLFDKVPKTKSTAKLWQDLLWESVVAKNQDQAVDLIQGGVGLIESDREFSLGERGQASNDRQDIFLVSLSLSLPKVAANILVQDPGYVRRRGLSKSVLNSLQARRRAHVPIDMFLNAEFDKNALQELMPEYWESAISAGDIGMMRLLLTLEPTLSFDAHNASDLANLDRALRSRDSVHLPLLIERKLDFNAFDYKGLDQLQQAMFAGDPALVDSLLQAGIDPRAVYRGRSILSSQVGGDSAQQDKIKAALVKHGATTDLAALVRLKTGVQHDQRCRAGKRSDIDFQSPEYYRPLKEQLREINKKTLSAYRACEVSLLVCTKSQEFGLDDCFESLPSCPKRVEDNGFSLGTLPSPVCCPDAAKKRYNEMRCAGLGVLAASMTLSELPFTKYYSVPVFFINTKEYKQNALEVERN